MVTDVSLMALTNILLAAGILCKEGQIVLNEIWVSN